MRVTWIALMLAAIVLVLAAGWLGHVVYWANEHGPEQRALHRERQALPAAEEVAAGDRAEQRQAPD